VGPKTPHLALAQTRGPLSGCRCCGLLSLLSIKGEAPSTQAGGAVEALAHLRSFYGAKGTGRALPLEVSPDSPSKSLSEGRRNGVADLALDRGQRAVEESTWGESLEKGGLPRGDSPVLLGMDEAPFGMRNPACTKPRAEPPAPEKRSMTTAPLAGPGILSMPSALFNIALLLGAKTVCQTP
jgi:hypothetical protein